MRSNLLFLLFFFNAVVCFGQRCLGIMPEEYNGYMRPENQEQYLKIVSDFCSLLTRWCNGERTLDSRIYSLCSGKDISVYDDIISHKETTLRNFLLGIQRNYPKSFSIEISKPSISNMIAENHSELYVERNYSYEETDRSIGYKLMPWMGNHRFLIFEVVQKTSTGSSKKYIIYNYLKKQITGFISGEGTMISFYKAVKMLTQSKNYRNIVKQFLISSQNKRAALSRISYNYASILSAMIGDYTQAIELADRGNLNYLSNFFKAERSFNQKKYKEAISYLKTCEEISRLAPQKVTTNDYLVLDTTETSGDSYLLMDSDNFEDKFPLKTYDDLYYLHYCIGLSYILDGNSDMGLSYLEKASNEGYYEAAYCIYKYGILKRINLPYDQVIKWLLLASKHGLELAQFEYGVYKEYVEKKKKEAIYWYYEASKPYSHPLALACLGRLCLKIKSGLPYLGYWYLDGITEHTVKDATNSLIIGFQKYLNGYKDRLNYLTNGHFWIKSKEDVNTILNQYSNYAIEAPSQGDSAVAESIVYEFNENYKKKERESDLILHWYINFKKNYPDRVLR